MLTFTYNIRNFKKGSSEKDMSNGNEGDRMMPPPGAPGMMPPPPGGGGGPMMN
ncbi:hypothetical protein D3C87_1939980 [compost metagenome]